MSKKFTVKDWADATWDEFSQDDLAGFVAVLPLAATEQHGPHLPLGTDTFIAEAYLARLRELAPQTARVLILPVQPVGISTEHLGFPGTLSLPPDLALRNWIEIGAGVARAGIRRLVIVTSHGGNSAAMTMVAQELRAHHAMFVVTASWSRFGTPAGLFSDEELRHGIHGGAVETSIMLAKFPDLVRKDRIANFASSAAATEAHSKWLSIHRPAPYAWVAQDLNAQGAVGDATAASAAKGHALIDFGARAFSELLDEVAGFDLTSLLSAPATPKST